METHAIYCSACDRQVRIAYTEPVRTSNPAGAEVDPSGICLDYSSGHCTGSMCALFSLPPAEMLERLRISGLET